MKRLLLCLLLAGCTTTDTFDASGKLTSRKREPDGKTWTAIGGMVATFGAQSLGIWANQIENQQRWERGEK